MDHEPDVLDGLCHACGAQLGGPYCGSCGAWNGESEPPPRPDKVCPACGTINPPNNLHCQSCAFRLDHSPQPTRSPLALVFVVAGVLGFVLILGFIVLSLVGGDPEPARSEPGAEAATTPESTDTTASTFDTTESQVESAPLEVSTVSASSSYSEDLGPENLIDGDPATYWNDASLHGEGAELIFEFVSPVAIDTLVIQSPTKEAAFVRNYRVRGYEITTDDLPSPIIGDLPDGRDQQSVEIGSSTTSRLVLRVTSTYEARSFQDQPPFEELAIAEITLLGRPGS